MISQILNVRTLHGILTLNKNTMQKKVEAPTTPENKKLRKTMRTQIVLDLVKS